MMTLPIPSEWGWFVVIVWVLWQVYAPKIGVDTRFNEIVNNLNSRIDKIGQRLDNIEERQSKIVAVTEVIAIVTDKVDGSGVEEIFSDEEVIEREDLLHTDDDEHHYLVEDENIPPSGD